MTSHQLEQTSNDLPLFWLGETASKVYWYTLHYRDTSLRMHLARVDSPINQLLIFPQK